MGRSPGGGNGNPVCYSCQENPKDRGAYLTKGGKALDMSDWADTEEEETVSDGRTGREIEQSGLQARLRIG